MKLFDASAKKRRLHDATSASKNESTAAADEAYESLQEFRRNLPVFSFRKQLLQAIVTKNDAAGASNKVILVVAQTGSGKSTQIPAYVLQHLTATTPQQSTASANNNLIAVTQPRRVAAMTLAQRVALEQADSSTASAASLVGHRVGYRVRFDDCTNKHETKLIYVTDGMLLREAMADPLLRRYSIIFCDEAHERGLQTDILLGVVQRARKARAAAAAAKRGIGPLRVVIMSATLDVQAFETFFGGPDAVTTIQIPGRTFPVQMLYSSEPVQDFMEAALSTIVQIHEHEEPGDILVFLPGQEEIEDVAILLRQYLHDEQDEAKQWTGDRVESMKPKLGSGSQHQQLVNGVLICVLYAALPPQTQMIAFQDKPPGCTRKIILSTNIAETSVTLSGIRYVVDPGKYKCRQVLSTGMESLTLQNISQAQAAQRAGRSGRVQDGVCFRLYTERALEALPATSQPEILRVNLAQVVLQLKGMGVADPTTFEYVTPPARSSLIRATKLLYALDALDDDMELTAYGKKLAKLPLDPVFGNLLLKSSGYSCTKEMLTAVSVLSAEHLFYRPSSSSTATSASKKAAAAHRRFTSHEGDMPTFLNVYSCWQNEAVYVPGALGGRKAQKRLLRQQQQQESSGKQQQHRGGKVAHGEWCLQNYVSGRSLVRAHHIRHQLMRLCDRSESAHGLGMDIQRSCGQDSKLFLKCVAAGLFMQVASRIKSSEADANDGRGRSGTVTSTRGKYRTKVGGEIVSIHPTSTLFNRQPAPSCVVYSELITTKRTFIRGVTQIREDWLHEVAPNFYQS